MLKDLIQAQQRQRQQQQFSNEKENSFMSAPGTPTRCMEDVKVSSDGKWPCANCHAMVSEDRCPFCHGIQVKIKNEEQHRSQSEAWIERVSPATIRTSGSINHRGAGKLGISVQRMILDDTRSKVMAEIDEDDEEELEQTSVSSPREYDTIFEEDFVGGCRPNNPVAVLLATAESPLPKFESPENRQDVKQQSKDRVQDGTGAGKKQRILFAAM